MLTLLFNSCCTITSRKCNISEPGATFRIVDRITERDLVFGPFKQYDVNSIKLFSLHGNDTTFYNLQGSTYTGSSQDSLMFTYFNNQLLSTVFVQLNATDIDTLNVNYNIIEAKSYCDAYSVVELVSYNLRGIRKEGGIYTCFK